MGQTVRIGIVPAHNEWLERDLDVESDPAPTVPSVNSEELLQAHRYAEALGEFAWEHKRLTFIEAQDFLASGGLEVNGDHAIEKLDSRGNICFWDGVSRDFQEVIAEALLRFLIVLVPVSTLPYTGDHRMDSTRLALQSDNVRRPSSGKWQPAMIEPITFEGRRVVGREAAGLLYEKSRFRTILEN